MRLEKDSELIAALRETIKSRESFLKRLIKVLKPAPYWGDFTSKKK